MTDNTEMVSVPRELLEKALKADASQGATAMDLHHGWLAMKALRHAINEELAAPAEDVRAVGDEPVDEIDSDSRHLSVLALHDVMQSVPCSSLYSLAEAVLEAGYTKANPQCPVVLPERMVVPDADCPKRINAQCWNACLDDIARLNK